MNASDEVRAKVEEWVQAIVTGQIKSGSQVEMWVRTTLGFQKREGVWQIANEHMSVPIDYQTLKASTGLKP